MPTRADMCHLINVCGAQNALGPRRRAASCRAVPASWVANWVAGSYLFGHVVASHVTTSAREECSLGLALAVSAICRSDFSGCTLMSLAIRSRFCIELALFMDAKLDVSA